MRPVAAVAVGLAVAFSLSAEDTRSYLQYDAVLEGEDSLSMGLGSFALFLRYYITDDGFAAEVTHYEPRWNTRNFVWSPLGLAFYSDGERFSVYRAIRDSRHDTRKPVGAREPARASDYSTKELAYTEAEILSVLDAYRQALGIETDETAPVHIERRRGQIHAVSWRLPEEAIAYGHVGQTDFDATRDQLEYLYDDSARLKRMVLHAPQRLVRAGGTMKVSTPAGEEDRQPYALFLDGGRITHIDFEDIPLGESVMRLPVRIETRHGQTGRLMRLMRHGNFRRRAPRPGVPLPWESWSHARESLHEQSWRALLGLRYESGETLAFDAALRLYIDPLQEIEKRFEESPARLRSFYTSYHSAILVNDEEYLKEGFAWYLDQLAAALSPRLVIQGGMSCIEAMFRAGREETAEDAILLWRNSLHRMDDPGADDLRTEFAERAPPYFVFRAFETNGDAVLTPNERFLFQYRRCMALQKYGELQSREATHVLGHAPKWWVEMHYVHWLDLVRQEFMLAAESFKTMEEPAIPDRRMMHTLEMFFIDTQEGRGFRLSESIPDQ